MNNDDSKINLYLIQKKTIKIKSARKKKSLIFKAAINLPHTVFQSKQSISQTEIR